MNDLKLSVKILLPGGMMVTQDESRHLEKTNLEEEINTPKMKVVDKNGNFRWVHYSTKWGKPTMQCINMTREAYSYMRSFESCPPSVKPHVWKSTQPSQRLEYHLGLVCLSLGGKGFSYEVFED